MERIRVVHQERAPWQVYVMVALGLTAGGWIFYAWNRQWARVPAGLEGWAPNAWLAAQTASPRQAEVAGRPVTDSLVMLAAPDKKTLAGKRVLFDSVCVRWMAGERAFAVSQLGVQPVFMVFGDQVQGLRVVPNRRLALAGRLAPVPDREQLRRRFPMLGSEQIGEIERAGLWIVADHVEVKGWY